MVDKVFAEQVLRDLLGRGRASLRLARDLAAEYSLDMSPDDRALLDALAPNRALIAEAIVRRGRPPKEGVPQRLLYTEEGRKITWEFLNLIRHAGPAGAELPELVDKSPASSPKGMGGVVLRVKGVLREVGIDPDLVFLKRDLPGGSRWFPGPEIDSAIQMLITLSS